jgi:hypothetical protein
MTMRTCLIARLTGAAFLLLCGVIACGAGDSRTPLVVERDSAGVRIVEAMRPLWGDSSLWRVDPDPVVDLTRSGTGPAHEFHRAGSMKQRPDGSLMIADRGSREVRVFSATGAFQASFGGEGDGPGEFRRLRGLENAGDTLLAFGEGRVAVAAHDLSVVRTFAVDRFTTGLHYLEGGAVLPELNRPVLPQDGLTGLVWRPEPLVLFDLRGTLIDSIGEMRGSEVYVSTEDGYRTAAPLFGRASAIAVHGRRILRGSSETMQVEELDMSGNLVRILRIPDYPLDLDDAAIAAERAAVLDGVPPEHFFRGVLEEAPASPTRPAFADILVDPSGAVWLELHRGESEQDLPQEWLVLDADGTWLGTVRIPDRFTVSDITMDAVLGVRRDELDLAHPQVLRLTRN